MRRSPFGIMRLTNPSSIRLRVFVLGLVVLGVVMPLAARENDSRVRAAKARYAAGERAFREGRFGDALREFETGHGIVPRAAFLLNMGHCQRRLGNPREAHVLYRLFLDADANTPARGEVESVLAELEREMAAASAPPPATPEPPRIGAAAPAARTVPPRLELDAPAPPRPVYKRWRTWTLAGSALALGAAAAFVFVHSGSAYREHGSLGTLGIP
jgi:hypothetical protein